MVELDSKFGRIVKRRLKVEQEIWLTTIGRDGAPQPRPVWFVWESDTFRKYKQGLAEINMTPEQFAREYSVARRVTPQKWRGW